MKTNTESKWDFKKAGSWRCTAFLRFSIRSGTLLLSDFDFEIFGLIYFLWSGSQLEDYRDRNRYGKPINTSRQ